MNGSFISLIAAYCLMATPFAFSQPNPDAPILIQNNTLQVPLLQAGFGYSDFDQTGEELFGDNLGPSRAVGGEVISITFKNPKRINEIKLTSYSNSEKGKILVHKVESIGQDKSVEEIEKFNSVMLGAKEFIRERLNQELKTIHFQVEGYTHNDASLLIEVLSDDGFAESELSIRRGRSNSNGKYGSYFDESDYPNFDFNDFKNLFANSRVPTSAEMLQHSWVCSSYYWNPSKSRFEKSIDFKTRKFFLSNNDLLKSVSNLKSQPLTWIETEEGLSLQSENGESCGRKHRYGNISRITTQGNIVSEWGARKQDLYAACFYYSAAELDRLMRERKQIPSYISKDLSRNNFEFCRPARF